MLIRGLFLREITIMTRIRALWAAMAVQTVALAFLLVTWSDGVPVLTGAFLDQFTSIHFALLILILPWAAARCSGDDMRRVAAAAGADLGVVALARGLAIGSVLLAIVITALPMSLLAARITNVEWVTLARSFAGAGGLCAFVTLIVTLCVGQGARRSTAWALGTAATIAAVITVRGFPVG
jgi:hypothetical protein